MYGSEHACREHDCLVTIRKHTSTLLTMDKRVAALIVQAHLLKSKHRAVKRLMLMKQRRDRHRREFVTRQFGVCDVDVYDVGICRQKG